MSHLEKFLDYARTDMGEISQEELYNGPDTVEEVDRFLYEYGQYVLNRVEELDPDVEADTSNIIDHSEHKNHWLQFYSDVQIGGRQYRVVLDECEFLYGKMAEDPMDFHNSTVGQIRSVIKNYNHVLNHVQSKLREHYSPSNTTSKIEDYLEGGE